MTLIHPYRGSVQCLRRPCIAMAFIPTLRILLDLFELGGQFYFPFGLIRPYQYPLIAVKTMLVTGFLNCNNVIRIMRFGRK